MEKAHISIYKAHVLGARFAVKKYEDIKIDSGLLPPTPSPINSKIVYAYGHYFNGLPENLSGAKRFVFQCAFKKANARCLGHLSAELSAIRSAAPSDKFDKAKTALDTERKKISTLRMRHYALGWVAGKIDNVTAKMQAKIRS